MNRFIFEAPHLYAGLSSSVNLEYRSPYGRMAHRNVLSVAPAGGPITAYRTSDVMGAPFIAALSR
ncbi:MAG TPA: hypothetical protein VFE27_13725 [Acidobacteriaceae bacterium]|nr:hypothetical protein [Acidobacteriaceae bacterium]